MIQENFTGERLMFEETVNDLNRQIDLLKLSNQSLNDTLIESLDFQVAQEHGSSQQAVEQKECKICQEEVRSYWHGIKL